MDEDLILLGLKIKKDPETYKEEYLEQLNKLKSLLNLPTLPIRQIKPMIFFIVKYSQVEPKQAIEVLTNALDVIKDYRTKRVVLNGLIIIRQKKLLESRELLRLIINHGNDLRYFLNSAQEFLDVNCYDILKEWYFKGTERQKSFSYFLLLVLFCKIHNVKDRKEMEREMKAVEGRIAETQTREQDLLDEIDYDQNEQLENEMSESSSSDSESFVGGQLVIGDSDESEMSEQIEKVTIKDETRFANYENIVDLDELEKLICDAFFVEGRLSKICSLYFLNRTEVKFDISKLKNGKEVGKRIYKQLNDVMDRDIKIMKLKIFVLFKKQFGIKKSILKTVVKMIDLEKEDLKDLLETLVRSVDRSEVKDVLKMISTEFVYEGQQEDIIVLGINMFRELYSNLKNDEDLETYDEIYEDEYENSGDSDKDSEGHTSFLDEVKADILKYIENFKGNRSKAIYFAYKNLIKVVVKGEQVHTAVSHIKRRATKEEMDIIREKGREEVKRLRAQAKREEKQEAFKHKRKGRKKTAMTKYMMKPSKKKLNKKKQRCK